MVLGGPQTAHEPDEVHPELVGIRGLLRQAIAGDVPTLGICLGAQLLAQAGGGITRTGLEGPEVGATLVAKRDAADADPLFGPLPMTPDVVEWHHDEISQLPVMADDKIVGIVDESDVLLHVHADEARFRDPVSTAMITKLDVLDVKASIHDLMPVFERGHVAIVMDGDKFLGLITRIDLLNYLRRRVQ